MCPKTVQSPADVLNCINWVSSNIPALQMHEDRYKDSFARYLHGPGRVRHHLLNDGLLTLDELSIPDDDYRYRSLQFLMMLTGSELLPNKDIKVLCSHLC